MKYALSLPSFAAAHFVLLLLLLQLGITKGPQGIISSANSRICCCGKDCQGACLRLVGSIYVEKEKPNHIKGKVKIVA